MFDECATQWCYEQGAPTGLSYPGVESNLNLLGYSIQEKKQLFKKIQLIERGALKAFREHG